MAQNANKAEKREGGMKTSFITALMMLPLLLSDAVSAATWRSSGYHLVTSMRADNGVIYVFPPNYSGNCLYNRLELRDDLPYSRDYVNRLYAMLLAAVAQKKEVQFTWQEPDVADVCVLNTLNVKW